jgi:hypothetical protein
MVPALRSGMKNRTASGTQSLVLAAVGRDISSGRRNLFIRETFSRRTHDEFSQFL